MGLSSYKLNVSIAVTDMTRAEEFYEGKLGLSVLRTGADGSKVYASGGHESLEVYPSPDPPVDRPRPWRPGTSTTSSGWSTS